MWRLVLTSKNSMVSGGGRHPGDAADSDSSGGRNSPVGGGSDDGGGGLDFGSDNEEEDVEYVRDRQFMEADALQTLSEQIKEQINNELTDEIIFEVGFDLESLHNVGEEKCGNGIHAQFIEGDNARQLGNVLFKKEAELKSLGITRILFRRVLDGQPAWVEGKTLVLGRELGCYELTYSICGDSEIFNALAEAGKRAAPTPARPAPKGGPVGVPSRMGAAPPARSSPTPPSAARSSPTPPPAARSSPTPPARSLPTPAARGAPAAVRAAPVAGAGAPVAATTIVGTAPTLGGKWSLRERKLVGERREEFDEAVAAIKSRLGEAWVVVIDWEAFANATADKGSSERPVGDNIVVKVVAAFVSNDVEQFDSDIVDALNGLCATKSITFSCKKVLNNGRVEVACSAVGAKITWSGDYWGYKYDKDYLAQWILNNC